MLISKSKGVPINGIPLLFFIFYQEVVLHKNEKNVHLRLDNTHKLCSIKLCVTTLHNP